MPYPNTNRENMPPASAFQQRENELLGTVPKELVRDVRQRISEMLYKKQAPVPPQVPDRQPDTSGTYDPTASDL